MVAKYLLVWVLLAVVAVTNGIIREATYAKVVSELTAHQVSTVTAILACSISVWIVNRLWPIQSTSQAWTIGISWLVLTVAFEFGFGHFVAGHSWNRLIADYNLLEGRVWSLFLFWLLIMPFVIYKATSSAP